MGKSVFLWAERLRNMDSLLGFKSCACAAPLESGLANDALVLAFQTPSQRDQFHLYGNKGIVFIDGIHNVQKYDIMCVTCAESLGSWYTTIFMICDESIEKYLGLPVAWMMASYRTEETIACFLRKHNPFTISWPFMSDRDLAQINAIVLRYPESEVWLCWWHVLHALQQHFVTSKHELL